MINAIEHGRIIKDTRLAQGMSAKKLQSLTGIHPVTIYRLEEGKTKNPHPATLNTLMAALGINTEKS